MNISSGGWLGQCLRPLRVMAAAVCLAPVLSLDMSSGGAAEMGTAAVWPCAVTEGKGTGAGQAAGIHHFSICSPLLWRPT